MVVRLAVVAAIIACSSKPAQPIEIAKLVTPADSPARASAWSLTASDGSGLRLVAVDAKAVVEGPLAFTELHLWFHNEQRRTREGTLAITLPPNAAVSRFAMEHDGVLTEAEVVPKMLARRAYDDFLHRGIDPAILEKAAGNEFTARVFPIAPHANKHLVISYSQQLTSTGYVLPLRGLPTIDELSVTLDLVSTTGERQRQTLRKQSWQPDGDFTASVVTPSAIASGTMVAGVIAVAEGAAPAVDRPSRLTLLVDTSGSRVAGFVDYAARVRTLVASLASRYPKLTITVIGFDQTTAPIYTGPAARFGAREVAALVDRGAAGASDLERALASVARGERLAIVTDGVATAGGSTAALATAARDLQLERVDVILTGGIRDERTARALVRSGARRGDVFDLEGDIDSVASGLGELVHPDVAIDVAGASWVYPRTIESLRSSARVLVYARLAAPSRTFDVAIAGQHHRVVAVGTEAALLERAIAAAEIEGLETTLANTAVTDAKAVADLRAQIEKLSVSARVISSETTMLVLETDADYARYGIDRSAPMDVLVVGPHGLERTKRTMLASADPWESSPSDDTEDVEDGEDESGGAPIAPRLASRGPRGEGDSHRADSLGQTLQGAGQRAGWTMNEPRSSGAASDTSPSPQVEGGRGGMRGRSSPAPRVTLGLPSVVGTLDRETIRRHVRRKLIAITTCYERELLVRPGVAGTISTRFTIGTDGRVTAARASGFAARVAACLTEVIETMEFPANSQENRVALAIEFGALGDDAPVTRDRQLATSDDDRDERPAFAPPSEAAGDQLGGILRAIDQRAPDHALSLAKQWQREQPTDLFVWIGMGEAYEAMGDRAAAARAYGTIIDLFPSRAELRRFAGQRLERTGPDGRALAVDTYRRAVTDRPDQVTGHRLLAYALLRDGDRAGALAAILAGYDQALPRGRFAGAKRLFARDVGMIATAYAEHGGPRSEIAAELARRQLPFITTPSTRFVLYWETDANDVDLHVMDRAGGHAWYRNKKLRSGGELYADVTTGFGPECFEIEGRPAAGPYTLGVHYYAQRAMGFGMGVLQVVEFDGHTFAFDDRPYVVTSDHAYVSLGNTR
ncbi:MAG: VIT domain-containing protein [Kofleriaceae bacterium]